MKSILLIFFTSVMLNSYSQQVLFINDEEIFHIEPNTFVTALGDVEGDSISPSTNGGFLILKGDSSQKLKLNSISKIQFENNKGIVLIDRSPVVNDSIEMISGIITTQSNFLGLAHNGKLSNTISNSIHVNGFFRKIGNTAFTFPVGNGTYYAPISISAPTNSTDHFTGSYYHSNPSSATFDRSLKDLTLSNISACEFWIMDRTSGTSNVQVTLSWDTRSCGVTDLSKLRVARWNGSQWKDQENTATTGTISNGFITSNLISSFSPFTLASTSTVNPLPIELTSFEAICQNEFVEIKWTTASEKNNDYFILQKSVDGIEWNDLANIKGQGTTAVSHSYSSKDFQISEKNTYYRLVDVSLNNTKTNSNIISSNCNKKSEFEAIVFPTLANDNINIKINQIDKNANYVIFDRLGRSIKSNKLEQFKTEIDINELSSGLYYIRVSSSESNSNYKFEKQ